MISENVISLYKELGLTISEIQVDKESKIYNGCTFKLNEKPIIYRTAKITPAKVGQFVTIWKRDEEGITAPFNPNDNFDFIIINCENEDLTGQFIFPKSVLLDKKIISGDNSDGKRGIRVYPPWDIWLNNQASKTQQWQAKYFINFSDSIEINLAKVHQLLKTES
jgi:hypothetical protein